MLKFFSRLERTRNFVLLVFAIIMVASLVLFYAPSSNNVQANLARSEETLAKVGDKQVTVGEVARQQESMSRFGGGQTLPVKYTLDTMIRSRIAGGEAERLGLQVSDAELAAEIRRRNKSDDGTAFDQKVYEQGATDQFGSVAAYEKSVREDLAQQKLFAFLTSSVTASEEEVLNDFKRKNTKFDLSYVPVNPTDLAQAVKPSDEELKNYFEQNKKTYYIGVPQRKIRYVFLNTAKIGEKISLSDEELRAEYDKLPAERKIAGVQGQELVLRVAKPEFEAQVTEKANQIVQNARKDGGKISEEAFAELAKGQSENPATAGNGGRLPGLVRQNPNKTDDPYQQLLSMQPGEVTEPISYQGRIFVLRRGNDVPKSFEDARKELEVSIKNRRAYGVAAELAQKVSESLKQTKDVAKTAEQFASQANMTTAEMIRETNYVKPGDNVENVGVSPQFEEGIATLANQGDVGERIPVQNGFAIPLLVDAKPPRDAEFEEVKDKVAETLKLEKARNEVEEIARQIASGAANAGALSAAAQSKGLKVQEQKGFILGSPLGQGPSASTNETLEDAIYGMKEGEVMKTPIKVGDNWYVVGVAKREDASMDDFAKQRDTLMQAMLQQKRSEVFSDYLAATRRKMETAGDIKIYKDALAKVDTSNTEEGITEGGMKTVNF
ncbi:MAG TPA: peptidylprolyl isomerase [Pyrinomonadaceae bacterium]|jgi:peptidyl-prolyl cis-trans isomerase D